jgi:hypothetical protein
MPSKTPPEDPRGVPGTNALKRLLLRLLRLLRTLRSERNATRTDHDRPEEIGSSAEDSQDGMVREPERTITMYAIAYDNNLTMIRDPDTGTITLPHLRSDLANEYDDETGLMIMRSVMGITIRNVRRLTTVDRIHDGVMTRIRLTYGVSDRFPSSPYLRIHTTSPMNTSSHDDPLIGGPVMRMIVEAFIADEAEATGPSPYQDVMGRIVTSNAHASWTNGDAIRILTSLMLCRGRIDRVLWNAFSQDGRRMPRTPTAAPLSFMAELGMGFEDLPEEMEIAMRGDPKAPYQGGLAGRLADTHRRYAAIRIPREWHPCAMSKGRAGLSDHMRGRWKALCDQVAEPLGLEPRYGVLVETDED